MSGRRAPLVGGGWNNGASAGCAALNLNNAPSNRNSNIGFRPALIKRQKLRNYGFAGSALLNGLYTLTRAVEYGWHCLFSSDSENQAVQYA